MSERYFTHASPTLFNAGTPHPQLSSCFLVTMKEDSIEGIYDTLKTCAMISKTAGGIGLNIHCIRATGCVLHWSRRRLLIPLTDRTLPELTVTPMASCPCSVLTTLLLVMSTRAATSVLVPSPSISSHGMRISLTFLTFVRTTERKKLALEISSTRCGSQIYCKQATSEYGHSNPFQHETR